MLQNGSFRHILSDICHKDFWSIGNSQKSSRDREKKSFSPMRSQGSLHMQGLTETSKSTYLVTRPRSCGGLKEWPLEVLHTLMQISMWKRISVLGWSKNFFSPWWWLKTSDPQELLNKKKNQNNNNNSSTYKMVGQYSRRPSRRFFPRSEQWLVCHRRRPVKNDDKFDHWPVAIPDVVPPCNKTKWVHFDFHIF